MPSTAASSWPTVTTVTHACSFADDWGPVERNGQSKLALEILVLPPLRAAAVGPIGFVLPLPLPLLGSLTTVHVLDSNLRGTFA
jgi:hypothetical protein